MALLVGVLVAFGRLSERPRDRRHDGVRREPVPPAAPGRRSWPCVAAAANAVGDDRGHPRRQPDLSRDHAADCRPIAPKARCAPREFFTDFPDTVLYVRDIPADRRLAGRARGGHQERGAADHLRRPARPHGRRTARSRPSRWCSRTARGTRRKPADPAIYETVRFDQLIVSLDPESVFPRTGLARGEREMTIAELEALIADLKSKNLPFHNPVMRDPPEVLDPGRVLGLRARRRRPRRQQSQGRHASPASSSASP